MDAAVEDYVGHGSRRPARGRWWQLARLAGFVVGGVVVVSFTDGLGAPWTVASWWAEPVVVEKAVVWTLLWQLLGLGRGMAPFAVGALPGVAGLSYWLTPGTMRLAPWPGRVPFTAGTRRSVVDVFLYAAVLALAAGLLGFTGTADGVLPASGVVALLVALGLLGLRDRAPFHAARPELVVPMLVAFLLPAGDIVLALKLVLASLGWLMLAVAANRHLPFAVATTLADAPWLRSERRRRALWSRDDHDTVPGDFPRWTAGALVVLGLALPGLLLFARGGALTVVAVSLAAAVLAGVAATLPRRGQLELTGFALYAVLAIFGHHAAVGFADLSAPGPLAGLAVALVAAIVLAATAPRATAVFAPWRHAAASGPVSIWLLRRDAVARFDVPQYEDDTETRHRRDLAVLALHPNGRALDGLVRRAVPDLADYVPRSTEFMAGAALGWTVETGPAQVRHLLAAIQERCSFDSGELRVVTLAAHSTLRTDYRYQVLDADAGLVEDGYVDIDDMIDRVPWRDPAAPTIPVEVHFSVTSATGYTAPVAFDLAPRSAEPAAVAADRPTPRPAPRPATGRAGEVPGPSPVRPPVPETAAAAPAMPTPVRPWARAERAPLAPFVPAARVEPIEVASAAARGTASTTPRPRPAPVRPTDGVVVAPRAVTGTRETTPAPVRSSAPADVR